MKVGKVQGLQTPGKGFVHPGAKLLRLGVESCPWLAGNKGI